MKTKPTINLHHGDCMEAMSQMPDNAYDLAIVDPPYGIGIANQPTQRKVRLEKKQWDNSIPSEEYFKELKRVSKNQIIWGGNYFIDYLHNSRCFLIWDKKRPENFSLAMCEMAWTSFDANAKILLTYNKFSVTNPLQENMKLIVTTLNGKAVIQKDIHTGYTQVTIPEILSNGFYICRLVNQGTVMNSQQVMLVR